MWEEGCATSKSRPSSFVLFFLAFTSYTLLTFGNRGHRKAQKVKYSKEGVLRPEVYWVFYWDLFRKDLLLGPFSEGPFIGTFFRVFREVGLFGTEQSLFTEVTFS